ncbi:MAG: TIGR02391 family protein [Nanoarchaeota archaeon]|nr:TIGR02391 family protein [Nanoarchaeota archaeon]
MTSVRMPSFTEAQLETLCKNLADTESGLTGSEIAQMLNQINVADVQPTLTKWKRLFSALAARQNKDQHGNKTYSFIKHALDPARYIGRSGTFEQRASEVNAVLSFHGFFFKEDGKFHKRKKASTLSEAEDRANRLQSTLESRGVHGDVLLYCRAELLQDNCFHAVLEASKSVASKIRKLSGLQSDGATLVDEAFGGSIPILRINPFQNESDKSEQRGFVNLTKGLFGTFRNFTAHNPKVEYPIGEEDALDLFSLSSYVHRRIDRAIKRQ